MSWIDLNEIASNSVVGVVLAAFSYIGTRIGKLITKIQKSEKDLDALWPRFRELEAIIKGELDAGEPVREDWDEASDRGVSGEGDRDPSVGDQPSDFGNES